MTLRGPRSRLLAIVVAVAGLAARAGALGSELSTVGSEFHLNTETEGHQNHADLATSEGLTLAVWTSRTFVSGTITGQLLAADGSFVGSEFSIGAGQYPSAAALSGAGFVVVWSTGDGASNGVSARFLDSGGAPSGAAFGVNDITIGVQGRPQVAAAPDGTILVVWDSVQHPGGMEYDVFGRFIETGSPVGAEFLVDSDATGRDYVPSVAATPANQFLVVWEDRSSGIDVKLWMQRYSASGERLGDQTLVNEILNAKSPAIAVGPGGETVVAWAGFRGSTYEIIGRRIDASGILDPDEFQVNVATFGNQHFPDVALLGSGHFVVVWTSLPFSSPTKNDVMGRAFDPDGSAIGGEFQLSSYIVEDQEWPVVAAVSPSDFLAVWTSEQEPDVSSSFYGQGLFGQRYHLDFPLLPQRIPTLTPMGLWMAVIAVALAATWSLSRIGVGK